MPFQNQHAARVLAPSKFKDGSFRSINIGNQNSGITAIVGQVNGQNATKVQSYRFNSKKFTAAEAKKWMADHKFSHSFEAAKN